jgi:DNA-directed RNA polymerase specialized sigma24 family protein
MRGTEAIDQAIDIERALACLTAKQREAVTLVMQGYTHNEIARLLGVTRVSVTLRISRVRNVYQNSASRGYR